MMNIYRTILAEGNGGAVKLCQKEAGEQSHELTNRNSIQGQVWERVCKTKRSSDFTGANGNVNSHRARKGKFPVKSEVGFPCYCGNMSGSVGRRGEKPSLYPIRNSILMRP